MSTIQQLLTEHLDIWTAADIGPKSGRGRTSASAAKVYGIGKLRELILELAVRGKLVPQDASDEPVSALLARILAGNAKLVVEGKLKKGKLRPSLSNEDEPFSLPQGWEWVRLGSTGNIFNGNSINENEKLEKYTNLRDGLPFIATKDVGYGKDELNYKNGVLIPIESEGFKIAHKGSVLICSEGGSAGKKIGMTDVDICFGNKLYANEVSAGISPRFIFYIYQSPYFFKEFSGRMTGIIGGISLNEFLNIPCPIPSESEQKRIVAKVDELMALCDELEAEHSCASEAHEKLVSYLLGTVTESQSAEDFIDNWQRIAANFDTLFATEASIDALKQTLLQLAVMGKLVLQSPNDEPACELLKRIQTEKVRLIAEGQIKKDKSLLPIAHEEMPFLLPVGWEWARLGELTICGPNNGYSPRPSNTPTDYRCLTLSATTRGFFNADCYKYVDIDRGTAEQFFLKQNDLLIQRANSIEYVGVTAIHDGGDDLFIYPDLMMRMRISEHICLRYLHLSLLSGSSRSYFRENATGTQGNMPKINQGTVINAFVPLPPVAEQYRIAAKVDELMTLCDHLKCRFIEASQLQQKLADVMVENLIS